LIIGIAIHTQSPATARLAESAAVINHLTVYGQRSAGRARLNFLRLL
jgi:hypothetical protein